MDDEELTQRAIKAYFRGNPHADQPGRGSGVEIADNGRSYVMLRGGRNDNGICAVYRVRNDGALKRLQRWPAALE